MLLPLQSKVEYKALHIILNGDVSWLSCRRRNIVVGKD